MDLISVIVPIYNVEKYLPKCIESIINQTYDNLEIILVNDGSPDGCQRICEEYEKKDDRIKVINKENGGVSSARNAGLEISKGNYIGFIDPDDYIAEEMYEIMLKEAKNENLSIVECDFFRVQEFGNCSVTNKKSDRLYNTYEEVLYGVFTNYLYPGICCKLFKREVIGDVRFNTNFKIGEDMLFFLSCANNNAKLKFISNPLYYYLQRQSSVMNRPFHSGAFDELAVLEILKADCNSQKLKNAFNSYYFPKLILISQKIIDTGRFRDRLYDLRNKIIENKRRILRFNSYVEDGKIHSISKSNKFYVLLLSVCPAIVYQLYPIYLRIRRKIK